MSEEPQRVRIEVRKVSAFMLISTCALPDHEGCDRCAVTVPALTPWRRRWLRLRWRLHEPGNRLRIAWTALRHGEDAVHDGCD